MIHRPLLAAATVLVLGLGGGCAAAGGGPPLPPPPPIVDVTMTEYRYSSLPTVPSGRVVFRVRNAGRIDHEVLLIGLSEDFPPIDEQLKGDVRRPAEPFAGVRRRPGRSGTFAVDLARGQRYALVCLVRDRDAQANIHALRGMNAEFRASGGWVGPSQPITTGDSQPGS